MNTSRIPVYDRTNPDGMLVWFADMAQKDLLFHPENKPSEVVSLPNGEALFSHTECTELDSIMTRMFSEYGEQVLEACYPVFMRKAGMVNALDA